MVSGGGSTAFQSHLYKVTLRDFTVRSAAGVPSHRAYRDLGRLVAVSFREVTLQQRRPLVAAFVASILHVTQARAFLHSVV
jgi:hypothetical protein